MPGILGGRCPIKIRPFLDAEMENSIGAVDLTKWVMKRRGFTFIGNDLNFRKRIPVFIAAQLWKLLNHTSPKQTK